MGIAPLWPEAALLKVRGRYAKEVRCDRVVKTLPSLRAFESYRRFSVSTCLSRPASFDGQCSEGALYHLKRNPAAKWLIHHGWLQRTALMTKLSQRVSACFSDDLLTSENGGDIVCLNSEVLALLLHWR